jgi:hypothetical protein
MNKMEDVGTSDVYNSDYSECFGLVVVSPSLTS